jgi:hypothetical protein
MPRKVKKRTGRPPVGSKSLNVRVPPRLLEQLDAWVERQPDKPNLPEAMRRLAYKALACEAAQAAI